MEIRVESSEEGPGISLLALLWLAVLASRRPSGTAHAGPPSCNVTHDNKDKCSIIEGHARIKVNIF